MIFYCADLFIRYSARAWAKLARRDDLLDKSLNNVIKYFLCSDHFTDDCFLDPPYKTKLKKTIRPVTVPMPSIFRCNIDQYIRYDPLTANNNSNAYNRYTCGDSFGDIADDTDRSQTEWIQYDVETHTNQLLIEQINDPNTDRQKTAEAGGDNIDEPISHLLQQHEVTIVDTSISDNDYNTAIIANDDMDDCMYLNKSDAFGYIEPFCLINAISPGFKATDIVNGVEEKSDNPVADSEACATLVDIIQDECVADSTRLIEKFNGIYDVTCRLCAKTFETDIGLIKIFSEDSERLIASINSIMPNTVSGCGVIMSSQLF